MIKQMYLQGCNIPGYMPDSEPTEHETLQEAKDSLVWWVEQYIDCMAECEEDYSKEDAALKEFIDSPAQTCNVSIGDYVFWITEG